MPTSAVIEIIPITCAGRGKQQAVRPTFAGQPRTPAGWKKRSDAC
jgi:hypothetical protein